MSSLAPQQDLYCPRCGYNLRGLHSSRCPECGDAFNPLHLTTSRIPWVHRDHIGITRAWFKTVWLASFRPKTLAQEISAPVSLPDALAFRRSLILANLLTVLVGIVGTYFINAVQTHDWHMFDAGVQHTLYGFDFYSADDWALRMVPEPWGVCSLLFAWGVFLLILTRLPSYLFFNPQIDADQNARAKTLAYYACAPLGFLPLLIALAGAVAWAFTQFEVSFNVEPSSKVLFALGLAALLAPALLLVVLWLTPVILYRRLTKNLWPNVLNFAFLWPLLWLQLALLIFGAVWALAFFSGLVISSW